MRLNLTELVVRAVDGSHDQGDDPPRSFALRSALGPALRRLACRAGCGTTCAQPSTCAYALLYEGRSNSAPPMRVDAADLDPAIVAGDLRKVVVLPLHDAIASTLVHAVRDALSRGVGPKDAAVRFAVQSEATRGHDVLARADEFAGGVGVVFLTPVDLDDWPTPPTTDLGPIVRYTWVRAKMVGLDTGTLPRFAPAAPLVATPVEAHAVRTSRFSARQRQRYPVVGHLGAWWVHPTPEQAAWLALAEAIGVGKGASSGQGILRCFPAGASMSD